MIRKRFAYYGYIRRLFSVLLLFLLFLLPFDVLALSSEKIAVLPFKIYMIKPMDHLVEGLQEMLTLRLAKEGFNFVDPLTINKSELSRIKVSELDFARGIGKEKGVDWIIIGSLTQIGKRISLDLTIIPISTKKKPFSIFVTEDSIDKLDQAIDKTAVTVTNRMKGIIQIDSVSVKGNKRIEADAILDRITTTTDLAVAVKDADLIIEAIVEDMKIKKDTFSQLDQLCSAQTVFATNTSYQSITRPDEESTNHGHSPFFPCNANT